MSAASQCILCSVVPCVPFGNDTCGIRVILLDAPLTHKLNDHHDNLHDGREPAKTLSRKPFDVLLMTGMYTQTSRRSCVQGRKLCSLSEDAFLKHSQDHGRLQAHISKFSRSPRLHVEHPNLHKCWTPGTDRHTQGQTDVQTDKETDRQRKDTNKTRQKRCARQHRNEFPSETPCTNTRQDRSKAETKQDRQEARDTRQTRDNRRERQETRDKGMLTRRQDRVSRCVACVRGGVWVS